MLIRGNTMLPYVLKPDVEPLWTAADYGRAATLEAKWLHAKIPESDRMKYIPCAVWMAKFPGIQYQETVVETLKKMGINAQPS